MKKYFIYSLYLSFAFSIILACSPTKNTFVSRNMNALATKFNVLYNGNVALDKGLKNLNDNYKDNFYKRIPIEALLIKEQRFRPSFNLNAKKDFNYFEVAEDKAVKAVQAHSINIRGSEKNSQIDDAYMLLGKARYYTQRFVPALDAFNYTIKNNSKANLIYQTRIWQAKTRIRLHNEIVAIESLTKMLLYNNVSDAIKEQAHTAMAMASVQIDSTHHVVKHLKAATAIAKNSVQNARNLFVLGQVYREKNDLDSSNIYFNKLKAYKKGPYKFRVQAQIEIAKNYQPHEDTDSEILMETLHKMIKNYDNKPYLDAIYHVMGNIQFKDKNFNEATDFYNLSLKSQKTDNYQKLLNYEQLGILNFNKNEFLIAGQYYDSVINTAENKTTRKIRQIKRKRDKLNDVVYFETIANTNDSILKIVALDSSAQVSLFNRHIAYLVQRDKDSIAQEKRKQTALALALTSNNIGSKSDGTFYFYNTQQLGFGKQEFIKIWGNRSLTDNWRYTDKTDFTFAKKEAVKKDTVKTTVKLTHTLNYYLDKLPKTQKQIDSIAKQRNDAYYQLGLIYKEQFKDYKLASNKLETLLTFELNSNLILPTHYHLYKTYSLSDSIKAVTEKTFILDNYPDSRYAKIIRNPNSALVFADENAPETKYKFIYRFYESNNFLAVDSLAAIAIKTYQGLPIVPKLKLLKAYAVVKLDGLKAFNEVMNEIALEYPNTLEGKKAKQTQDLIKNDLANADNFKLGKNKEWYLALENIHTTDLTKLTENLRTIIYEEELTNLSLVEIGYNRTSKLLLIKGFASHFSAKDFTDFVHKKYKNIMPDEFFVISQSNYNKIQQHKNLEAYLKSLE